MRRRPARGALWAPTPWVCIPSRAPGPFRGQGPFRAPGPSFLLLLLLLALAAGGCAYEVRGEGEAARPERLARLRKVAVTPFRYSHDWTGQFRAIYRRAEVTPPELKKVDMVEATFLPEDALAARGYEIALLPKGMTAAPLGLEAGMGWVRERLARLRARGAEGVLLTVGESRCLSLGLCTARVEMAILDARDGALLWRGRAEGSTLFAQGDEMRAAVRRALADLPEGPAGR